MSYYIHTRVDLCSLQIVLILKNQKLFGFSVCVVAFAINMVELGYEKMRGGSTSKVEELTFKVLTK